MALQIESSFNQNQNSKNEKSKDSVHTNESDDDYVDDDETSATNMDKDVEGELKKKLQLTSILDLF